MKKIISLVLCLCTAFLFVGCGEKEEKAEPYEIDVNYYAKLGAMPEVEYALGADVDHIITAEEAADAEDDTDGHDHTSFFTYEEGERTLLVTGGTNYYYDTDNKDAGISYIVNFDASYGFALGTYSVEIENALKTLELEGKKHTATEGEVFYIPGNAQLTVLEYTFEKNTLKFIFQEDMLCATALYK